MTVLPADHPVRRLCVEVAPWVTRVDAGSVIAVLPGGIELRFVLSGAGWVFDEVVGAGFLHVEQMADRSYWLGFGPSQEGYSIHLNIGTKRAKVAMTGYLDVFPA